MPVKVIEMDLRTREAKDYASLLVRIRVSNSSRWEVSPVLQDPALGLESTLV
jgi:hypothetical protein